MTTFFDQGVASLYNNAEIYVFSFFRGIGIIKEAKIFKCANQEKHITLSSLVVKNEKHDVVCLIY